MSLSSCCLTGFTWDGTPAGTVGKLCNNDTYIAGKNPSAAILLVHDAFGWTFPNVRLLADHYAREADATVYVPDFFGGEILSTQLLLEGRYEEIGIADFIKRNGRGVREPEIFDCARALKKNYEKVGAIGFCYGGWASFRLGAREHQPPLVDCISIGHPSLVVTKDIDDVAVPVQILASEIDHIFTPELKLYSFETITKVGLPFDYQHFSGVEHGCLVRGDEKKEGEREAMVRGKNAAVAWFNQFLHAN
ncbi:Alpha/Beta hydrolase protein [Pseudomassariella vexata]|uniref:Alpha/Beta hydrolase protein n=1 Tax=Pseudomassariella vexata TaxID=1141098 RepID=A0A1Y2E1N4_9PEZI|nr:Alpha/Beta hydrolase protein [Pseudomassariella vexata]ORY64785.1 Alpha/Beta hydrolase protein [Pseudomassariella vexata]